MSTPQVTIVAALARNGVIGRDNRLIWQLKSDLRRFRDLTLGKPLVMGRLTYDSIGRPLPGRHVIVVTRDPAFSAEGVVVVRGWPQAREAAERTGASEVMVGGGAQIYALALPDAERLCLTEVNAEPEGDTVFPAFDRTAFRELRRQECSAGPNDEHPSTFVELVRRAA